MKRCYLLPMSLVTAAALSLGLTGCAGTNNGGGTPSASATGKQFTIGIATFLSHPALQAVDDGFQKVLKDNNINYKAIEQNAQGDTSNAATIASGFASNKNIDLILAIATPVATAMASAVQDKPILFSAVTDPVGAGLVPSWTQAGQNITGTSDLNPDAKPVSVVQEAMPNVNTIGVLYSSSESNSLTQLQEYQTEAASLGVTIKPAAITSAAEISVGLQTLSGVDAILIPTDNTVVASIATVIQFGQENQIPVFCADDSTVSLGTVATRGLSYEALGEATGQMAVQILNGTPISSIPPQAPSTTDLTVNTQAAATFGLTLPASFVAQGTDVQTTPS